MGLPRTFARRLASASQPVIITEKNAEESALFAWLAERAWLGALAVASLVGVLLIASVSTAATRGHHLASHAPKTLVAARSSERHAGHHTPAVKTVRPVKSVTHHRLRRR